MAGGIGSRFWPLSKDNYPKQFLEHFHFYYIAMDCFLLRSSQ